MNAAEPFLRIFFSHSLSTGTLKSANRLYYENLADVEGVILQSLLPSEMIHCKKNGYYVNKHRHWLHGIDSSILALYKAHRHRGKKAMNEIGVLPTCQGTALHDYWSSYSGYSCRHALGNAHHLREVTFLHEKHQQQWPQ